MKEKTIKNLALLVSTIGILSLFLISINTTLPTKTSTKTEGMYKVRGIVDSTKEYNTSTKLTILTKNKEEILLFKSNNNTIPKGIEVEIEVEKKNDMIVGHSIKQISQT